MPNEAQPVAQEAQPSVQPQAPQAQAEPDYKQQFEELKGKYGELEGKYKEAESLTQNLDSFLSTDEIAQQRGRLWVQAKGDPEKFRELVKSAEGQQATPKPKGPEQQAPILDESKIAQMVKRNMEPLLDPIREKNAEMDVERSKAQLFKEEPWMTEDKYKEFETKFGKTIDEITQREFAGMGPFMTQAERQNAYKQAENRAYSYFSQLSDTDLVRKFMSEDRDKWIAEGRRPAPKLPDGMVNNLPTGKAPELMTQLQQKYKTVQGNGKKVAELCQEYAPQLGMPIEKVFSLLNN